MISLPRWLRGWLTAPVDASPPKRQPPPERRIPTWYMDLELFEHLDFIAGIYHDQLRGLEELRARAFPDRMTDTQYAFKHADLTAREAAVRQVAMVLGVRGPDGQLPGEGHYPYLDYASERAEEDS